MLKTLREISAFREWASSEEAKQFKNALRIELLEDSYRGETADFMRGMARAHKLLELSAIVPEGEKERIKHRRPARIGRKNVTGN